jgi:hypothetical protein
VTIDMHAHVIVPEITGDEAWQPRVWRDDSGNQVVDLGGKQIRAAVQEFVDVDGILAAQDAAGVDRVLLCPWVPLLYYDAEPEEGLARASRTERSRASCGSTRTVSRRSVRSRYRTPNSRPVS